MLKQRKSVMCCPSQEEGAAETMYDELILFFAPLGYSEEEI